MRRRKPMGKKRSTKLFKRTAGSRNAHKKNYAPMPMRGGIRL